MHMTHYFEQLRQLAQRNQFELKDAFIKAGIPDSTYYRALHGQDIRYATALKVARVIQERHPSPA
jgi:predicted transcriptional regulator